MPVIEGALATLVYDRLTKALGPKRTGEVLTDAVRTFGSRTIDTPQDLLDLATEMARSGGLVEVVARSLKVQALLRGAVERR